MSAPRTKSRPASSANGSMLVEPFKAWQTPQDLAEAIQRLHHALFCGEISHTQATAHVGLLRLYIANMYIAGPRQILPGIDRSRILEGQVAQES